MGYWLYIVECADGSLYTGLATDIERRLAEHNGGLTGKSGRPLKSKGARYTSVRRPVVLVYQAAFATRSEAAKEEARIKRLTRPQKLAIIAAARSLATTSIPVS
ncbi:MAG: GIY-YIG nuclease family protein [Hyphomicrobium sp.]|nr:GIY-YIG nuclease family protein [Hyphomicrobium sp.]